MPRGGHRRWPAAVGSFASSVVTWWSARVDWVSACCFEPGGLWWVLMRGWLFMQAVWEAEV